MVCIISKTKEYSTDTILDWLSIYTVNNQRINCNVLYNSFNEIEIKSKSDKIYLYVRKFASFQYQRDPLLNYIGKEQRQYLFEVLESNQTKIVIGSSKITEPNRISTIQKAQEVGLKIPDYLITTSKITLLKFLDVHQSVITKPLVAPPNILINAIDIAFRTSKVLLEDVKQINDSFYPTFFQEQIKRDYEVRLFYLKGKCWAMAFVVKEKNETSPDIWNIKRRREVPILVPQDIQIKVKNFMDLAGYNTGSLDFIISGKKWYFLELNPSGQYDFVSKSCNYFLDREIAKVLKNETAKTA